MIFAICSKTNIAISKIWMHYQMNNSQIFQFALKNESINESSRKLQFQNQDFYPQSFSFQQIEGKSTDQSMTRTFYPMILPVNQIHLFNLVHQKQNNIHDQIKIKFHDSFKISFFEALTINFPKEPRYFICQYLKSLNCPVHIKSVCPLQYIKREKIKNIIKILHQFHSEFCTILAENNFVSLLLNIYHKHIKKVSNQKKTKIKIFVELYKTLDDCLEHNIELDKIKTEISVISSSF
jgi:hypothetical protein